MRAAPLLTTLLAAFASLSCEDESLRELHPAIALCPSADAPATSCNVPLELGDVPVTLPHAFEVFVVNVGQATLSVARVTPVGPLVVDAAPTSVVTGGAEPISLVLSPTELGAQSASLDVASDDPNRPVVSLPLRFVGVPKPASKIELCDVDGSGACGKDIGVDFGVVRRSEEKTRTVLVNNNGVVPLVISEIRVEGASSVAGELAVASSIMPGVVEPGSWVPVLVRYRPEDAGEDLFDLVFASDDPEHPEARASVTGASLENDVPLASAVEASSGLTESDAIVGRSLVVDGAASADPEGDPLRYRWTVTGPAGSSAALSPAGAPAVALTPDLIGDYTVALVVEDSLGQESAPATVLLHARAEHALRVTLEWSGAGDLDLHLVASGAPFGAGDCYFGRPQLTLGDPGSDVDDAVLLSDGESAPGSEEAVIAAPVAGSYALYAHAFAGLGAGSASATVSLFLDGEATAVLVQSETLDDDCDLWHVADVVWPEGTVLVSSDPVVGQCP